VKTYRRHIENVLNPWLNKGKVLIISGARQVGKTTLLKKLFDSRELLWLNADETRVRERFSELNLSNLEQIVGNHKLVVIDEIQRIENAGLMLKLLVDNFKNTQFVATGSSALDISERIFEPLTGRHLLFHLYPFALSELYATKSVFEIEEKIPFHMVYGSYPDVCLNVQNAKLLLQNLAAQYLYKDVLIWKDIRKPQLLDKLLQLLAYQIGCEVSIHELAKQLKVSSETVENYIDLLEKSFVVFRLNAYSTNPRKEISKMSKIYFWDNGIRNAVIGSFDELNIRKDAGQLWENFMISERLKLNSVFHPERRSFFWRNYNQSEVDYVETEMNLISAFEIKWNSKRNFKVSSAFNNEYPNANNTVVTPKSFSDFCMNQG
jgi:uncharacterized protein